MKHATTMPGSTLSTATSNGMNAHHADTSVQSRFGTTTAHGEIGAAYKPCVARGRNNYGNLRIGASAGSDTDKFVGGLHVGYEHNFALRHGWELFVQAKCDLTLPKREDLFRSGIVIGFKIPTLKK